MREYEILQIDAFTDRPLGGNPCAVVLGSDDLDAATMLAVAREMNLSETAFVVKTERADFGARYFTPLGEIPMAGHPTVATIFALVETGQLVLHGERTHVTLELPAGILPIEVSACDGRVVSVTMSQPRPRFAAVLPAASVLPAFGLAPADAHPTLACRVVSTGTPQLLVPLAGLAPLRRIAPDPRGHAALAQRHGFFSTHLFALEGVEHGATFARHFAPGERGFEDPFTGSATGAMGAYLWRERVLGPCFTAEQGHWMGRPGRAEVEVVGAPDAIETVRVGGAAVGVLTGRLRI
jgi:trans-2,3-dihydro-3-hydroxyanthranilate isomerase